MKRLTNKLPDDLRKELAAFLTAEFEIFARVQTLVALDSFPNNPKKSKSPIKESFGKNAAIARRARKTLMEIKDWAERKKVSAAAIISLRKSEGLEWTDIFQPEAGYKQAHPIVINIVTADKWGASPNIKGHFREIYLRVATEHCDRILGTRELLNLMLEHYPDTPIPLIIPSKKASLQ